MCNKILISAFADEYDSDFTKQLDKLNELNISYIELRNANSKSFSDITEKEAKEAKKLLDEKGVLVSSLGSHIGKVDINIDMAEYLEKVKRAFQNALILGTKNVRIFSFYLERAKRGEFKNKAIDNLGKILLIADEYSLNLCHENEANIYGESPEDCLGLMKVFDGKLKAAFDMGNFVLGGYNPVNAYKMLKPHIEYFHIKDSMYSGEIVPPGIGQAEIKSILKDYISTSNRDVFASLEPHLGQFEGLASLTDVALNIPQYADSKTAFVDAAKRLEKIICEII